MSKDIRVIREECCKIWNRLKDKTKMIDYLIESKQQIADLEAKLIKSEMNNSRLNSKLLQFYTRLGTNIHEQALGEFCKLKQQLAEKDKEIKRLHEWLKIVDTYNASIKEDKISFAVEMLEKVKGKLRQNIIITAQACELKKLKDYLISVDDYIDNQIKQLKEKN